MGDDIDVARGNVLDRKGSAIQERARALSGENVLKDNGGRHVRSGEKKPATKTSNADQNDLNNRYPRQLIPYSRAREGLSW